MENYSLFMGAAAALLKMAVEMAAVSMEKPSGALPAKRRVGGSKGDDTTGGAGPALAAPATRVGPRAPLRQLSGVTDA
ncbi:hypothetical protein QYE76_029080 [Lolium multiflorum]|uniref:Uncharacterized protein n=1 Tax=Lolium multiflorum TaxID=4521 RepID=A0AAD8QMZ0_LOLMU|nr:hypothetical protein QYE76_029080 [Lolium multiflorum]